MQGPLDHFWTMYISGCGVSEVVMKEISKFVIDYWNAHHFLKINKNYVIKYNINFV